jgi:hypothetical protein
MVLNRYKFNNFELKTLLQIRTFKPVEQFFLFLLLFFCQIEMTI